MPSRSVTVGTAATVLLSYNERRTTASFTNNGAVSIFVGNDIGNLLADGYPIAVGGALDLIRAFGDEPQDQWFGIVASTPVDTRVLEQYGRIPELVEPGSAETRGAVLG